MFLEKGIKSFRSLIAIAVVSSLLAVIAFFGCNDHHFTPVAQISVLPSTIEYTTQQTISNSRQVLITNDSVSAKLEIYEINFKDQNGEILPATMEKIRDQSELMKSLKEESSDGTEITYSNYPSVLVSDVSCNPEVADYCNCDASQSDCSEKESLGPLFMCDTHPTNKNKTVCQAHYDYFNNAGESKVSTWGKESEFACVTDDTSEQDDDGCKQYGSEYSVCENNLCRTDIKQNFSVEYGLEQLIAITNDVVKNKDKAARWKAADGRALCLKKINDAGEATYQEDYDFFGLNRCDQMAYKQLVNAINDGQQAVGFELYPKLQSTYRVLSVPNGDLDDPDVLDIGQTPYIVYCDDKKPISYDDVVLEDPIDISENCVSGDGLFKEDLLSVSSIDDIKIDELPLRVLYSYDPDFGGGKTITQKFVNMGVLSNAKVGGQYERDVQLSFKGSLGRPPIPVISIADSQKNPVPLDKITLDGTKSYSDYGEIRKPFDYKWEWAPGGKPANATDAVLIASNGSFDTPVSIMGSWTSDGMPKIYFPIAGVYKIRLKVRDKAGEESGPNDACPTCEEWYTEVIDVKPSKKIHIELTWDKGDNVDFDMFLVRYREDGTFGLYNPTSDNSLVVPQSTAMPQCTSDADCFGGALTCGTSGICENKCTTDEDCTKADLGWYCDDTTKSCFANNYVSCDEDADCPNSTYCTPVKILNDPVRMVCTKFPEADLNDTCSYIYKLPRWGEYSPLSNDEMSCELDDDCNGVNEDVFTCDSGSCDFSCTTSSECLSYSDQFICSKDSGFCHSNSTEDDPSLDIDDVNGWGPENISVKEPETGLYRVVVRLYADPNKIVKEGSPSSGARATVQIYLNGDRVFENGISHDFYKTTTFWKVADIYWDSSIDDGDGEVVPICAGWTNEQCDTDADCQDAFGANYTCSERVWEDKFCTACAGGYGTPDECEAGITCVSNDDCANEDFGKNCTTIKDKFCHCDGSNEFGAFSTDPYANPFSGVVNPMMAPTAADNVGSIWCDSATQSTIQVPTESSDGQNLSFENVDLFSDGSSCSSLY